MIRSKGFTLIELLVVIAIIAILAAILFPIFTSAKAKGLQTTCANNMRQIVTAMLQYADDHSGKLTPLNAFVMYEDGTPAPPNPADRTAGKKVVPGSLMRYLKNWNVLLCPSDSWYRKKATGQLEYTYTINGHMTYEDPHRAGDKARADREGVPVSYARNPSKMPLLIDESTEASTKKSEYRVNDMCFIFYDRTSDRHRGFAAREYRLSSGDKNVSNGVANVGYLDSHMGILPGFIQWREHPEIFCIP